MKTVWILNLHGYGQVTLNIILPIDKDLHDLSTDHLQKFKIKTFINVLKEWQRGVGKDYKTSPPNSVDFGYGPWRIKQRTYEYLPLTIDKYITLVEAFTCVGDKFGLKDIQVVVEIKTSSTGTFRTWAEIYYVYDAQIPALIIEGDFVPLCWS